MPDSTEVRQGRKPLYDYDTLFNGDCHEIVKGIDFQCEIQTMRRNLYNAFRVKGLPESHKLYTTVSTLDEFDTLFNGDCPKTICVLVLPRD